MAKQEKGYTPEQVANTEKVCKLINEIPVGNRTFVSTFMLAYMSGMEAGIMYTQDAQAEADV